MRFFRSLIPLVALSMVAAPVYAPNPPSEVIGLTECYPSCSTFTDDFPSLNGGSTPNAQDTTWSGTISLNQFDAQGRILKKITVKTKIFFESTITLTCQGSNCAVSSGGTGLYGGDAFAGMDFKMDLDASTGADGVLRDFWGRWGDYPLPTKTGVEQSDGVTPFFQPYTYPLFDIVGFTRTADDDFGGDQWAYYNPLGTDASGIRFWFGDPLDPDPLVFGQMVSGGGALNGDPPQFTRTGLPDKRKHFVFGSQGGPEMPLNTPVNLGTLTFDQYATPLVQVIDLDGASGGINSDITPATAAAPFLGSGEVLWFASATGIIDLTESSGNAENGQVSTAKVAMQVIYEFEAGTNGDPQFSGFQGQQFQIHGYPGSYFHLLSSPNFQMNGRFAYLATGHCTYKHTTCWTHPGTYIDDITFVVNELLVRVTAGPVATGYTVSINDEPFHAHEHVNATDAGHAAEDGVTRAFVPTKFYDAATRLTVHLKSPLELVLRNELFSFTIMNADHFFNIGSQILVRPILTAGRHTSDKHPHPVNKKPWFPEYPIHGFIGQTWMNATYAAKKQYEGDVDDYVETRPYATDSIYSQYNKKYEAHMLFD